MNEAIDQLADINNAGSELMIRDHKIIVTIVTMKNLGAFVKACSPFLAAFDEAGELAANPDKQQSDFALFKVLANNGPAFMEAAALVSNAPVSFYERLRPDEFFEVAALVVKVNGDFFIRALAPALIKFAQGVSLIGTMLSGASLQQDTGVLTSSTSAIQPSKDSPGP